MRELPNNGFGIFIMILLIILSFISPFTLILWMLMTAAQAPLWVSIPVSLFLALASFCLLVKFKQK